MSRPPEDVAPSTAAGAAPEDPSPDGASPAAPGLGLPPPSSAPAEAGEPADFATDRPRLPPGYAPGPETPESLETASGSSPASGPEAPPELPPELLELAEKLRGSADSPGALGTCLNSGTPVTRLLAAILIGVFVLLASGSDWRTEDFWKRSFGDVTFSLTRLEDAGSLTPLTLHEMPQLTRLVSALALHPGPWSLILSLMMLYGAGRFVERLGGSLQLLAVSLHGLVAMLKPLCIYEKR